MLGGLPAVLLLAGDDEDPLAPEAGRAEITALYTARFGEPRPGERLFIVTRQQKDGWQAPEHETTEIVPPKPPPSRATGPQSLPHPVSMYTGCTTVAHRISVLPTPNLPTGKELPVPEVPIAGREALKAVAAGSVEQLSGENSRPPSDFGRWTLDSGL